MMFESDTYERLLGMFYHADEWQRSDGMAWYQQAHDFCREVAGRYDVPLQSVVAATSALSPGCSWDLNKWSLLNVLSYGSGGRVVTYRRNKEKALSILAGGCPVAALNKPTSLKTWNFYNNILTPQAREFVTLDRHMAYAFGLRSRNDKKAYDKGKKLTIGQYRAMHEVITDCARMARVRPNQMQAVIWNVVRANLDIDK